MTRRVIAVDWSGRAKGAAEAIWLAEAVDGKLVDLRSGATPDQLIAELCDRAQGEPLIVGLDFAFSFPEWWCRANGWHEAREVWAAAATHGGRWLRDCPPPFWGRPGRPNPHQRAKLYRRSDREVAGRMPKSVFQIGGAGAVGTGSIMGMPQLRRLAGAGFAIWPFDDAREQTVIEIYPRALTVPPVRKASWRIRHEYVFKHLADQQPQLLERAAGSEDAFDAAVSALAMSRHADAIAGLRRLGDPYRIEGCIWSPTTVGCSG